MFAGSKRPSALLVRAALALAWGAATGCGRPAIASLMPLLELGVSTQRLRSGASQLELVRDAQGWHTTVFVALRFQPRPAAAAVPARGELAPESWLLPCDTDDVICLQEALEAEAELARVVGDLQ